MRPSRHLLACLLFGLVTTSLASSAQEASLASLHFQTGAAAFDDQRFADAAAEFEAAYAQQPRWQLLYNLGSVYCALGRPVEAVDRLERYLNEGADGLSAERRSEVSAELERQRVKLAQLDLFVSEAGAEVRVDALRVGWSPLAKPVTVAAGKHVIDVSLGGSKPERRELDVRGQQTLRVEFTLTPSLEVPLRSYSGPPPDQTQHFDSTPGKRQRATGYVIGGLGVLAASIGTGILLDGESKHQKALKMAGGDRTAAEKLNEQASNEKKLGLTLGVSGSAAILGGVILLVTAPKDPAPQSGSRFEPWVSASQVGLNMKGAF